jgi:hypothetical protein
MGRNHDIIEVCCQKKHETEKAILVVNLKNKDAWLAKSQIQIDSDKKGVVELQMPEWLALDKELI